MRIERTVGEFGGTRVGRDKCGPEARARARKKDVQV